MRNAFRVCIAAILAVPVLIWHQDFAQHIAAYLSGSAISIVIQQQWHYVVGSIALFVAFLVPLTWRRKAKWTEYGLVAAFFVSLFVEMFGIPLTLMFASRLLPQPELDLPPNALELPSLGVGLSVPMLYGSALTAVGMVVIAVGWFQLYRAVKRDDVVTTGVYALSRHPQYVGFILVLLGWLVGWPTLLTLLMAPLLIAQYVRVCLKEEAELDAEAYSAYRHAVPMFI